jgi:hypothetical protein
MSFIFRFLCLLTFCKYKQWFVYILKKTLKTAKGHQYGYQMKGLDLGSKNMCLFLDFRVCLHFLNEQWFVYILKNLK